jgi:hypothetical protein
MSMLVHVHRVTLRQVVARLEATYCNTLGVEYMHMRSREKCNWIRRKVRVCARARVRVCVCACVCVLCVFMYGCTRSQCPCHR